MTEFADTSHNSEPSLVQRAWEDQVTVDGRLFTARSTYVSGEGVGIRSFDLHPPVQLEEMPIFTFEMVFNEETTVPLGFHVQLPNFYSKNSPHKVKNALLAPAEQAAQPPKGYDVAKGLLTGNATAGVDVKVDLHHGTITSLFPDGRERWSWLLDDKAQTFECVVPEGEDPSLWRQGKDMSLASVVAVFNTLMASCLLDEKTT